MIIIIYFLFILYIFYILFILVLSVVLLNDDLGNKTMNNLDEINLRKSARHYITKLFFFKAKKTLP